MESWSYGMFTALKKTPGIQSNLNPLILKCKKPVKSYSGNKIKKVKFT